MRRATSSSPLLFVIGMIVGLCGLTLPSAQAQTVLYVNDDASGAEDGSLSNPYTTLQDALEIATGSEAYEIRIAEGMYYPDEGGSASDDDREVTFELTNNLAVKGGYSDNFSSRDPSTHLTVLSGDIEQNDVTNADGLVTDPANDISGNNSYRVVTTAIGASDATRLDGVTITAGNADESGVLYVKNSGGGLHCTADIEIRNVHFIGNRANNGGAVEITLGESPTITDVVFEHNTTIFGNGGGLDSQGTPILTRVTFRSNTAYGRGAGMHVSRGTPVLRDVLFEDNQAGEETSVGHGGGMSASSSATLENVTFRNNRANKGNGGGFYASGLQADVTLRGVLFEDNESGDGGGMAASEGHITLTDVIFRGNTTTSGSGATGGGGLLISGGLTTSNLTRVRFEKNTSAYDGGGMVTHGGVHALQDVHFVENTASYDGGGLSNDKSIVTVVNAAFRGNEAGNGVVFNEEGAEIMLVNAVLSGNVSTSTNTGAVMNDHGTATLKNVVVTGNGAIGLKNGGFASDPSTMTVHNSIIYGNTGLSADEVLNRDGSTMTFAHTLVRGGLNGPYVVNNDNGSGAILNDGGSNIGDDPLFVTAISAGSAPTTSGDFHLQEGSPARQAGSNALVAVDSTDLDADADSTEAVPYDLDSRTRVAGTIDLGPYESDGTLPQVTQSLSAGDDDVSLPDHFGLDLTFETLGTDTDVTVTYDPAAESGTLALPDGQGLALTALWTIAFDPEPDASDLEASVCFDLGDLYLPTVDRSALKVYARSGPSTSDWAERTPTELRPSADDPQQLCLTGQNAFSQFAVTANESELPVELVAFDAAASGKTVRLTWQTAAETDNAGFEVERNVEGQWQTLGFVEGAGTTHQPQDYRFTDEDLPFAADRAAYRLRQIDTDGTFEYSAEIEIQLGGPERLMLHGNYPNPFAGQTTIRYELPAAEHVRLTVYDVLGRAVAVLVDRSEQAGRKELIVDGSNLPSGQYFVRLEAGDQVRTEQVTIVR